MYAANLGLVGNVKLLLARGADATRKNKQGDTALSLLEGDSSVARAERREVAELLRTHLARKKQGLGKP
jgi:ankyrin repeat protein